ncbi:phosphotransferase [Streptomyces albipurpureus]|uniref:Aminoglycoside phosphotransferase family protein n=1 Tax=Streptomyces albipurpureus TaxID=2897419 RepID=A0ABT0UMM9_9ACTN|nr:phosphotransferase [Streptomyces sp. CWNU-1]MCM2389259.1 aminoglycoside phosphotransferase family protein [Streptomyces sp. CWNU-1]
MSERVGWDALPGGLRQAVEARTGEVIESEVVTEGLNCSTALVLHTQRNGRFFLKGVRESQLDEVAALRMEELINPTVRGIAATIRHSARAAGWYCLVFAHLDGRHADLSTGEDLAAIGWTLRLMHCLRVPDFPVPPLVERYAGYLEPGEKELLSGGHLLHTDTNPHNLMIGSRGGSAYVIDWAMPALGPVWVDAAYTAVRLMECDQTPESARQWLASFPAWRQADPRAVKALVEVTCRHWSDKVGESGAAGSNARFRHLLEFPHEPPNGL